MTGKELLEAYPKAAETVVKYYSEQFIKSIEAGDVSDEIKEYAKGQTIDLEYVATFMDINPRGLFDVFDSNGVYIEILVDLTKDDALFSYVIDGNIMSNVEGVLYNSRIEAEKVSIEKAFELLNDKL
jgi:hypothetical protein